MYELLTQEILMRKKQKHRLQKNITYLMASWGYSDADIASATGVPVSTIKRMIYVEDTNPTASSLIPIAKIFNVSIDELLNVDLNEQLMHLKEKPSLVPILDIKQVSSWMAGTLDSCDISESTACDTRDEKAFAVENIFPVNDSMKGKDATFVISPALNPKVGDIILMSCTDVKEPFLSQLFVDHDKYYYLAKHNNWEKVHLNLPFDFYGTVVNISFIPSNDPAKQENLITDGTVLAPFMTKCNN